jgi:hypothetical protein
MVRVNGALGGVVVITDQPTLIGRFRVLLRPSLGSYYGFYPLEQRMDQSSLHFTSLHSQMESSSSGCVSHPASSSCGEQPHPLLVILQDMQTLEH